MKNVITVDRLVEILKDYSGVVFCSVTYYTDEHASRTVNGKKVLQKMVTTRMTLGSDYQRKINRILKKQDDSPNFKSYEMRGFVHTEHRLLVKNEKTGMLAIQFIVEKKCKPHVNYFYQGKLIEKSKAIELGLFTDSFFKPKKTAGRGAIDGNENFHCGNLYLKNILSITLNGKRYRINHNSAAQ